MSPKSVDSPGLTAASLNATRRRVHLCPAFGHQRIVASDGHVGHGESSVTARRDLGQRQGVIPARFEAGSDGRPRDRVTVGIHDPAGDRRGRFERDDDGAVLVIRPSLT